MSWNDIILWLNEKYSTISYWSINLEMIISRYELDGVVGDQLDCLDFIASQKDRKGIQTLEGF